MVVDDDKLQKLLKVPPLPNTPQDLRRDGNVFRVGGELPPRETLETLYDSHCLAPAELFHLLFGAPETFQNSESLVRLIKRNFSAHILGTIDYPAPAPILERAYAAGIDIIDIPLVTSSRPDWASRLDALLAAKGIFPRWSVVSTLTLGEGPLETTLADIDFLLTHGIVPLLQLPSETSGCGMREAANAYRHLTEQWHRFTVTVDPLLPLIDLVTPLAQNNPGGVLRRVLNRLRDRRLVAASDLRRALRVRQVEESFESAGL